MSEPFRVAVAGPSRVGKTTLVTAILEDTRMLLGGTPVSVEAAETTETLIRDNQMQLRRALAKDVFDAASLGGSQDVTRYDLLLQADSNLGIEVPFTILDYPGRWLNPGNRTEKIKQDWVLCEDHVKHSIMLLLPIDAAVLMEATSESERAAVQDLLAIRDVEQVTEKWAKARNSQPNEPAVVVLAPLKCEKYFDDNGGDGRQAALLSEAVVTTYEPVLATIRRETPKRHVRVIYAPIDTYGCVELMEAEWVDTPEDPSALTFKGHYRWRRPRKLSVKAAGTVIQELCKCIVDGEKGRTAEHMSAQRDAYNRLVERREEDKGFFGALKFRLGGEARRNKLGLKLTAKEIGDSRRLLGQLEDALVKLAETPADPRVQEWRL